MRRFALPLLLISIAVPVVARLDRPASAAPPVPGTIATLVGPGVAGGLSGPYDVAVSTDGTIVIADTGNRRIRQIRNGVVTTIAGCEACRDGGGPEGTNTMLQVPIAVAFEAGGALLIADPGRCQVLRLTAGIVTVVAGIQGGCGYGGDGGPAIAARIQPASVAADANGNIFIAELPWPSGGTTGCRIRRVSSGIIETVAGTGTCGYSGDGGPAVSADVIAFGIATDAGGIVYLSDWSGRIRKIARGTISTVAGTGVWGYTGDGGDPLSAQFSGPRDVTVAPNGDLYIADTGNRVVRRIGSGVITTVAGHVGGLCCPIDMGDGGPATQAWLGAPTGVAADAVGNIYIVDWAYDRGRIVYGAAPATPTATATATATAPATPSPTLTASAPAPVRPVRTATLTTTATPPSLPTTIPTQTVPAPGFTAPNGQPPLAPSSNDGNEGDRAGVSVRPARLPNSGAGTRDAVGITDGIVFVAWAGVALLISGAVLGARKRG